MNISLVMIRPDGSRRDFPITREKVVIGRTNSCDLRVPLSSVSRQHCELIIQQDKVKLRDLGSSNGTFHNHIRVQEAILSAGDQISVGSVTFRLLVDGHPDELASKAPVRPNSGGGVGSGLGSGSGGTSGGNSGGGGGAKSIGPAKAKKLPVDDDDLPVEIDEELHTPTVDLDDSAVDLEALANAGDSSDSGPLPLTTEDRTTLSPKPKKKA